MENNELQEKLMGNALSYQKTLARMLGPLNEMSPIAKEVEQQMKSLRALAAPIEEYQKQIKPIQDLVNNMGPVLSGVSEACREASLSVKNLSFPKITVTYSDKIDEVPMPVNRELYLAKDSERQINELKDEIISLKAEIKSEREERQMKGFIEYPEMYMEHPELAKLLLERIKAIETEANMDSVRKNHTGSNEKTTQRERNKKLCYELFDEMMEKAPKMNVAEIKKVIASKMHTTTKTINGYLRERP